VPESRFKVFTIEYIVKKIIDYSEEKAVSRVRAVGQWKMKTTENVVRALLKNSMDVIAT